MESWESIPGLKGYVPSIPVEQIINKAIRKAKCLIDSYVLECLKKPTIHEHISNIYSYVLDSISHYFHTPLYFNGKFYDPVEELDFPLENTSVLREDFVSIGPAYRGGYNTICFFPKTTSCFVNGFHVMSTPPYLQHPNQEVYCIRIMGGKHEIFVERHLPGECKHSKYRKEK